MGEGGEKAIKYRNSDLVHLLSLTIILILIKFKLHDIGNMLTNNGKRLSIMMTRVFYWRVIGEIPEERWFKLNLFALLGVIGTLISSIIA